MVRGLRLHQRRHALDLLRREADGWYTAIFAASNFVGALLLGPLFDSWGRVRMISGTYLLSGGISGPLLFGKLIENATDSKDITGIALGYFIGAALMIVGGITEIVRAVKAEGRSLERVAKPLMAEDP